MKSPILVLAFALAVGAISVDVNAQKPCQADFDGNTFANNSSSSPFTNCIKTKATAVRVIMAVQFFTGERVGVGTVGIWSHDAAKDEPKAELARGTWNQVLKNSWQGANLNKPVLLKNGETFWVSWIPVAGSQTSTQGIGRNLPGVQTYKWSSTNAAPWNGPYIGHQWKFRLFCTRLVPPVQSIGNGCKDGNAVLGVYSANGDPAVGNANFSLVGSSLPYNSTGLIVFGVNPNFQSIDLSASGAPGCFIHSDEVLLIPLMTTGGVSGKSNSVMNLKAAIPNNSKLKGVYFRTQLWVRDPASRNLLPATFTNGIGITIQ